MTAIFSPPGACSPCGSNITGFVLLGTAMRSVSERLVSIRLLQENALAPASLSSYLRHKCAFKNFCLSLGLRPRYKKSRLLLYLEELYAAGKAPATLRSAASAIAYYGRLKGACNLSTDPAVLAFLAGVERERSCPDVRRPFTVPLLIRLAQFWNSHDSCNALMWISISSLAFFGMFRLSELVPRTLCDVFHAIRRRDVEFTAHGVSVELSSFKHNRRRSPVIIEIAALPSELRVICPLANLQLFYGLSHFREDSPLFRTTQSAMRQALASALSAVLGAGSSRYTFHSFRIGGASYFASCGWDEGRIRRFGRWSSTAFMRYIRRS